MKPHEGPSQDDIARFGGDTAPCKHCGADVYDDAEWCHKCGKALGGSDEPARGIPTWALITAGLVVLAILSKVLGFF